MYAVQYLIYFICFYMFNNIIVISCIKNGLNILTHLMKCFYFTMVLHLLQVSKSWNVFCDLWSICTEPLNYVVFTISIYEIAMIFSDQRFLILRCIWNADMIIMLWPRTYYYIEALHIFLIELIYLIIMVVQYVVQSIFALLVLIQ